MNWRTIDSGQLFSIENGLLHNFSVYTLATPLKDKNSASKSHLESITGAFYALDKSWCFSYFNAEAERLLRRKRSEVLGKCVWDEFPQTKGAKLEQIYRQTVSNQEPSEFEYFYPPLNSWHSIRALPAERGVTVYFTEITERKAIEAERQQLITDLNERIKEQRSALQYNPHFEGRNRADR